MDLNSLKQEVMFLSHIPDGCRVPCPIREGAVRGLQVEAELNELCRILQMKAGRVTGDLDSTKRMYLYINTVYIYVYIYTHTHTDTHVIMYSNPICNLAFWYPKCWYFEILQSESMSRSVLAEPNIGTKPSLWNFKAKPSHVTKIWIL
jgi:hypothetical protein